MRLFYPATANASVEFRVRHHADCAKNTRASKRCDCAPVFLARAGCQTFSIGRDGALTPYVEAPLTREGIVFFDPATARRDRSDQRGFEGEFDRDLFGRLLVPLGTLYREFTNGVISFAEAGLPPAKLPTCQLPDDHE